MPQNKDTRRLNQSLYPNCKSKEANVKKGKKFFNGQVVKIQGRRRQRGKVDRGPGPEALGILLQPGHPFAQLYNHG